VSVGGEKNNQNKVKENHQQQQQLLTSNIKIPMITNISLEPFSYDY